MSEFDELRERLAAAELRAYPALMISRDELARLIAAADSVMFSDEAAERAARVLVEVGRFGVPWEDASDRDRAEVMEQARAVIAALTSA